MTQATTTIVVCDDEPDLRDTVGEYLSRRGYDVRQCANSQELDTLLDTTSEEIGALLLDVNMPGEDGLSVLRRLRAAHDFPVLMLTAAGEVIDRIVGLEMGADDYLPKPVDLRELEARIKAVLRRGTAKVPQLQALKQERVAFDELEIELTSGRLFGRNGDEISLTSMEFNLLKVFIERRGRVLNRDQLLELAHDRGWDPFDRSIDIRISRLRRKIEREPTKPQIIRTVRGVGYIFDPPTAS